MTYQSPIDPQPWMTRKEAWEYLRIGERTLDERVITWDGKSGPTKGKIRAYPMRFPGGVRQWPRLVKKDVYALLPRPDRIETEEPTL
jgi:hypothetical protein